MADTIKETSVEAVEKIKGLGVTVYMVTGDNEKTAQYVGKLAHVDQVVAEVLPEDKAQVVNRLQNEGKTVMMVGESTTHLRWYRRMWAVRLETAAILPWSQGMWC